MAKRIGRGKALLCRWCHPEIVQSLRLYASLVPKPCGGALLSCAEQESNQRSRLGEALTVKPIVTSSVSFLSYPVFKPPSPRPLPAPVVTWLRIDLLCVILSETKWSRRLRPQARASEQPPTGRLLASRNPFSWGCGSFGFGLRPALRMTRFFRFLRMEVGGLAVGASPHPTTGMEVGGTI